LDVTDIVDRTLDEMGVHPTVFRGRGGAGPRKFRALRDRIEGHASRDEVLVFVGKSYGGHWSVKLLWELSKRGTLERFRAVGLLTVDPAYALHRLQHKVKEIPTIERARNVHQHGFRSGYRLGEPATNILVDSRHTDIETVKIVGDEVRGLLEWACAVG